MPRLSINKHSITKVTVWVCVCVCVSVEGLQGFFLPSRIAVGFALISLCVWIISVSMSPRVRPPLSSRRSTKQKRRLDLSASPWGNNRERGSASLASSLTVKFERFLKLQKGLWVSVEGHLKKNYYLYPWISPGRKCCLVRVWRRYLASDLEIHKVDSFRCR